MLDYYVYIIYTKSILYGNNRANVCECNGTSSTTTQGTITSNPNMNQQCTCNKDDSTKGPPTSTTPMTTILSSQAKFQAISALAVSQDGVVHVADQGKFNISKNI